MRPSEVGGGAPATLRHAGALIGVIAKELAVNTVNRRNAA